MLNRMAKLSEVIEAHEHGRGSAQSFLFQGQTYDWLAVTKGTKTKPAVSTYGGDTSIIKFHFNERGELLRVNLCELFERTIFTIYEKEWSYEEKRDAWYDFGCY